MSENILKKAVSALEKGEIICYPTDTLYGLGADIKNIDAVKKLFNIKKRSIDQPLSVAVSDLDSLEKIAYVNKKSKVLIDRFLPGQLCILLKKKKTVPDIVTSGLKKVAIRIPDNKTALEILRNFGPITCTSANIHGKKTPNEIKYIRNIFKDSVSVYFDEGILSSKASTIVDVSGKNLKIIRKGAVKKEEIVKVINNE